MLCNNYRKIVHWLLFVNCKHKALDKLGINEFWENSGVYDLIDSIFGEDEDSTVSQAEAKGIVDNKYISIEGENTVCLLR